MMDERSRILSRAATLLVASVALLSACGQGVKVEAGGAGTATPETVVPAVAQNVAAPAVEDPKGHRYVLALSIDSPGQRIDSNDWDAQVAEGPLGRGEVSFGKVALSARNELDQKASPDMISVLDPNGSQTIVGFFPKSVVFESRPDVDYGELHELPVFGSDGKTIVGYVRQTRATTSKSGITHVETTQEFVEVAR